ncbi:glycosyltransferase family 4 protein [Planctomonas psychrotolerans]|uniref:glycosyltransferase family 4 protein n=1 Tax=Planctomonas psychrotolerans TaxID=2528712 RepID=UPI0012396D6A|nr:glycosyltransferase family 4 protein [Planctomonas psychrotolerans]
MRAQPESDTPPVRVVFVTAASEPWGAEHSLRAILQAASARGVDTEVLCSSTPTARFFRAAAAGPVRQLRTAAGRVGTLLDFRRAVLHRAAASVVVIFSLQLVPLAPLLRLSPAFRGVVVVDLHDVPQDPADSIAVRTCIRFADALVAISDYVAVALGIAARATVVPRPIPETDPIPTARDDSATVVGIVGRVDPEKRIDVAIDAIAALPAAVTLEVYGSPLVADDTYLDTLSAHADAVAPGRVRFLGRRDPAEIYREIDVLLVANENEPSGRTVGEAMMAGKPVVTPRAGGSPEYYEDGVSGLSYTPRDAGDAARALRLLVDDPGVRMRMGAAARAKVLREREEDAVTARYLDALLRSPAVARLSGRSS